MITDSGYNYPTVLNGPYVPDYTQFHSAVRARNEMENGQCKRFKVLTYPFHHFWDLHTVRLYAVANITQTNILHE